MNTIARQLVRFPWCVLLAAYVALNVIAAICWELIAAAWGVLITGKERGL